MVHIKEPLLLIVTVAHKVAAADFFSQYLSGLLPYVQRHMTIRSINCNMSVCPYITINKNLLSILLIICMRCGFNLNL